MQNFNITSVVMERKDYDNGNEGGFINPKHTKSRIQKVSFVIVKSCMYDIAEQQPAAAAAAITETHGGLGSTDNSFRTADGEYLD